MKFKVFNPASNSALTTLVKKLSIVAIALSATACSDSKWESLVADINGASDALVAFDPDGNLDADITWTTYGVPHIKADNLESLAFGNAYAYARDNYCALAEQMVKVKSERSKYFGADKVPGSGDSEHIVSDFGYKALGLIDAAAQHYPEFSENTRAILEGYSSGFNQYRSDTGDSNLAPQCASAPWLSPVSPQELAAYYQAINLYATSSQFLLQAFFANPGDGSEYLPVPQGESDLSSDALQNLIGVEEMSLHSLAINNRNLGSNAWALGSEMTENGNGALLANPHFPMVGNLRFWQSHLTIPGVMDVAGAALQGFPILQFGFNDSITWSHTVSNADHLMFYRLDLVEDDRMSYSVDGLPHAIEKRTFSIDVKTADNSVVTLVKDYYVSHHGLMIEFPAEVGAFGWDDNYAYTLRDAVANNWDSIDHWLAMAMSSNLEEFQSTFKRFDGTAFVNTLYSDREGNTFYIDNSNVFDFDPTALDMMRNDPEISSIRDNLSAYVLPGGTSLFEPIGLNSYERSPKLQRSDFVQNSNQSYWATNPAEPLSGYSIAYGREFVPLTFRTRMSLTMLDDSRGADGRFSAQEIESALHSNRAYLGELVLADLLSLCGSRADTPVELANEQAIDISAACQALSSWDGTMKKDSVAAHLFREFAHQFNPATQLTTLFNATDPINTPNTLASDESVLVSFAAAVANLEAADIEHGSHLGEVQFFEKSLADGSGSGNRIPWAGANEVEGGFNIYWTSTDSDSVFDYPQYSPVVDVQSSEPVGSGLSTVGYPIRSGASWIMVVSFTDNGPKARGILTNSQSSDSRSPHFDDQTVYYAENQMLRPINYKLSDIEANTIEVLTVESATR